MGCIVSMFWRRAFFSEENDARSNVVRRMMIRAGETVYTGRTMHALSTFYRRCQ